MCQQKQFLPPVGRQNATVGYSLKYALSHTRKRPHKLPAGWRWLEIGEYAQPGDVSCDPRIAPVKILCGYGPISAAYHPIRTKRPSRKP